MKPPDHTVLIVRKHHWLVRWTHWLNVPLLFGLIATGLAIYWAAPVFKHAPDPVTGSRDHLADLGFAIARLTGDPSGGRRASAGRFRARARGRPGSRASR